MKIESLRSASPDRGAQQPLFRLPDKAGPTLSEAGQPWSIERRILTPAAPGVAVSLSPVTARAGSLRNAYRAAAPAQRPAIWEQIVAFVYDYPELGPLFHGLNTYASRWVTPAPPALPPRTRPAGRPPAEVAAGGGVRA